MEYQEWLESHGGRLLRDYWTYLILFGILAAVVAVYGRALGYEHLHAFDDNLNVINRPEVRDWWGATWRQRLLTPQVGYSVAVPTIFYAQAHWLFPEDFTHVLHGLNVSLHLLNVGLVFALAKRWGDERVAVLAAAMWGLHPIQVESVAWLTNLKVVLFGTGSLLWLLGCEAYVDRARAGASVWPVSLGLVVVFLLTLGCRPNAVVFPLLAGLVLWRRGGFDEGGRALWIAVSIAAAVSVLYVPLSIVEHAEFATMVDYDEAAPLWETFRRMTGAIQIQAANFWWPHQLHPAYYMDPEYGWREALPGVAIYAAAFAVSLYVLVRGRSRLGTPWLLAVVAYAPYTQIVSIPRLTADSYMYVPSVGLVVAGAGMGMRAWESWRWPNERLSEVGRVLFPALFGLAVVSALGLRSFQQVGRWRNLRTLWAPTVQEEPRAWKPYMHVGWHYYHRGEFAEAAAVLDEGLPVFRAKRIYPDYMPVVYERVGDPRRAVNLAAESLLEGRLESAHKYRVLLDLLARHQLPMTEDERLRGLLERAVDEIVSDGRWMRDRSRRLGLARYFVAFEHWGLARPFLRAEFQSDAPACEGWGLADRLPESVRTDISPPPRPERCVE